MKSTRHCKECGEEVSGKFCKNCGTPIGMAKLDLAVTGMVCHSCDSIIKRAASKLDGVISVDASYKCNNASITYDPKKVSPDEIILAIKKKGYKSKVMDADYKKRQRIKNAAVLVALIAVVAIVISVSNSVGVDPSLLTGASLGVVFVFGLLTGFHCLGMCGGFVISYSTKLQQKKYNPLPHLAYNFGRVITYTFLGLIVGFLGSLVSISYGTQGVLIILASFIMVLLGLNLMGVLTIFRGVNLGVKNPLSGLVSKGAKGNKGPFVLGLLNGFVPCGMVYIILFTYVPLAGSAIDGAIAMAVFGLGTIPLMFTYGSALAKLTSLLSKNFVRYSGVIVLVLAVVMFNRGMVLASIPDTPEMNLTAQEQFQLLQPGEYQEITMTIDGNDFVPNRFTVEAGKPVKWTIVGKRVTGCSNEIIQADWEIDVPIETGETKSVFFLPEEKGTYTFSCWMAMLFGEIEVK
jgi:sulfite exporter TauE/SafE/copper chaperone CopZ